MLKFPSTVAAILLVGLGLTNCAPLRAQQAELLESKLRKLPLPNDTTSTIVGQNSSESPLVSLPASPPPAVTLGAPAQHRALPTVTLGVPVQQGRSPTVSLGLPEEVVPNKTKTRLISEGPTLAEMALPPELGGLVGASPAEASPPAPKLGSGRPRTLPAPPQPPSDSNRTDTKLEDLPLPLPPPVTPPQFESLPTPPAAPQASQPQAIPSQAIPPEGLDSSSRVPQAQKPVNPLDALPPALLESVPQSLLGSAEAQQDYEKPPSSAADASESSNRFPNVGAADKDKKVSGPYFFGVAGEGQPPIVDSQAWQAPYTSSVFSPQPISTVPSSPQLEASPYRDKFDVPTQRPWVELWRPFYAGGIYPPAKEWFGRYNLAMPHFIVYGDYRTGVAVNRNAKGDTNNWASRLNLDMDLKLTSTERLHALMGPLDRNGDFTRLDFTHGLDFVDRTDIRFDNLYFEGDAGAILGGLTDQSTPFDLPFSFGFLPLFYQNGIWANDNVIGAAMALPSKNSPLLKWANYDATLFWASDQVNTDAFAGDNNAAEFFGSAWFIEAYDGYIEADYAFVHDDVGGHRSYHNLSVAYTRRYFMRVSNSIRYITNFGQSLPSDERTADGHMILLENSLISKAPNTLVPYLNLFYGQGRTQSLARANVAGGILNNTGINFETDGLTGYPTLDATGVNATGAALGVNILGADFQHQLILEVAALSANGHAQLRNAPGDEYAIGMRYQKPLSNAWIFRTDHMVGWRENASDLRGSRVELRWKF
ncbi:MAG: hypothetical protein IT422_17880 [Pirellulaceae bacterium]|jgi:hypothetical protein|nr:hypothetical protein [Pirellulaceae bacterium]